MDRRWGKYSFDSTLVNNSNAKTCWRKANTKSLKKGHTDRRNTEFNTCGICASSEVPTYNIQHQIQMDT